MSHTIPARNVSHALGRAIDLLLTCGTENESRNGTVIALQTPCIITYENPTERILVSPLRDANPFFHIMEALWMLAGRNDLDFPKMFNSGFGAYSDDGVTLHGAYGHRWRKWFGHDQLDFIVQELHRDPSSRRAVLQMWDGERDPAAIDRGGKDVPCNTVAYFDLRGGKLNMMVSNRSNDAIWGAFGANAVHFSVLQEYIAARLGKEVGLYHQVTNNLHIYTDKFSRAALEAIAQEAASDDLYSVSGIKPMPMFTNPGAVAEDLELFFADPYTLEGYGNPWFATVAVPLFTAYESRKAGAGAGMVEGLLAVPAMDLAIACSEWVARRDAKKASK